MVHSRADPQQGLASLGCALLGLSGPIVGTPSLLQATWLFSCFWPCTPQAPPLPFSGSPLLEFSFFIWILLHSGHSVTGCRPSELLTCVAQVRSPPCLPVFLKWDAHPALPHVQASLADQVNEKSAEAKSFREKETVSPPQGTWEAWSSEPGSREFPFVWGGDWVESACWLGKGGIRG